MISLWHNPRCSKSRQALALLAAMISHPILIERPLAIKGMRAVIARPPQNVAALL